MKYTIIFAFLLTLLACQSDQKHALNVNADSSSVNATAHKEDTSYVVLQSDTIHPVTLSSEEITITDTLLAKCIKQYGFFEFEKYQRQYIPSVNAKGEKFVWVNCFCREGHNRWRRKIIIVEDGGKCYFQATFNLTTKTFFNVSVNGLG